MAKSVKTNADSLAAFSGVAPVTKRSGKHCQVHRRFACPKYLRQTFHEYADSARIYCPWTKARYHILRDRGMKHHAALRKIARSWIRILYRVWKTREPFDCDRYIATLKRRCPEIAPYFVGEHSTISSSNPANTSDVWAGLEAPINNVFRCKVGPHMMEIYPL